jgi:hypothetical protein
MVRLETVFLAMAVLCFAFWSGAELFLLIVK